MKLITHHSYYQTTVEKSKLTARNIADSLNLSLYFQPTSVFFTLMRLMITALCQRKHFVDTMYKHLSKNISSPIFQWKRFLNRVIIHHFVTAFRKKHLYSYLKALSNHVISLNIIPFKYFYCPYAYQKHWSLFHLICGNLNCLEQSV